MQSKLAVKSYTFRFRLEPDRFPDGRRPYRAYIPELETMGAATWGYTKEEAIKNFRTLEHMIAHDGRCYR